jgi:hypothetical protein
VRSRPIFCSSLQGARRVETRHGKRPATGKNWRTFPVCCSASLGSRNLPGAPLEIFHPNRPDNLKIIDPPEMKLGFPADPNRLPATVVKALVARHGCIKLIGELSPLLVLPGINRVRLIEPYASYETQIKRELRHIALASAAVFTTWSVLARAGAQHDYHRLSLHRVYIDWARAAKLASVIALIFFVYMIDFRQLRATVDTASLSVGLWAGLATLFLAMPEGHAKALGLEDEKLMIVLSG